MKKKFLIWLCKNWKKNKDTDYVQTWYYMPQKRWLRNLLQWICGKTHHEPSDTEWGYGGGNYADGWCRWCNKMFQVPKESVYFKHREARGLMNLVGREFSDINLE